MTEPNYVTGYDVEFSDKQLYLTKEEHESRMRLMQEEHEKIVQEAIASERQRLLEEIEKLDPESSAENNGYDDCKRDVIKIIEAKK